MLVSTDDPERAVAALDGLVERRDGTDLVVRSPDPAALNARLVAAGVPVSSLLVQRRSLEEIVLEVTGTGSDQFSVSAGSPREAQPASQAAASPAAAPPDPPPAPDSPPAPADQDVS